MRLAFSPVLLTDAVGAEFFFASFAIATRPLEFTCELGLDRCVSNE
jgi:hypothetical protein